jgi:aminopeptidase N
MRHKYQAASWDDLRAAFEEAGGRSLRTFFEQWVGRPGAPEIAVTGARVRNGGDVEVTVTQGAPAYVLDVPLELVGDEKSEMRRVPVDRERQDVKMVVPYAPQGVRLDPDLRLWRKLATSELSPILRQWIIATAPRLAIVSANDAVEKAAREVALAFFENAPQLTTAARLRESNAPVLLAGLQSDVDAALESLGAAPRPPNLAGRGTAQVWTVAASDTTPPLMVISAQDAQSLRAVRRALPHLGSQKLCGVRRCASVTARCVACARPDDRGVAGTVTHAARALLRYDVPGPQRASSNCRRCCMSGLPKPRSRMASSRPLAVSPV